MKCLQPIFVNRKINSLLECGFLKQKSQTHAHCLHAFLRTDDHAAVSTHEVKPQRRHACRAEGTRTPWLTGTTPRQLGQGTKGSVDQREFLRDWCSALRAVPGAPSSAVPGSDLRGSSSVSCLSEAWASLPHSSTFARVCLLLLPQQPLQGWILCLWSSWVVSGKKSFIWFFYIYAWKLSLAKWWGYLFSTNAKQNVTN